MYKLGAGGAPAPAPRAEARAPLFVGTKLLVNNLDPEITAEELKELFESIGAVRSASIELDADGSKGTGQVVYRSHTDAQKAIEEFHGRDLNGRIIRVHVLGTTQTAVHTTASTGRGAGSPSVRGRGATGSLYSDAEAAGPARAFAHAAHAAVAGGRGPQVQYVPPAAPVRAQSFHVTLSGAPALEAAAPVQRGSFGSAGRGGGRVSQRGGSRGRGGRGASRGGSGGGGGGGGGGFLSGDIDADLEKYFGRA